MKFFKKVSIVIGFVLTVVLLAVLGIQLYLNTAQAKEKIQARVNQAIPGELTWKTNRFSILKGEAEFNHVRLRGPLKHTVMELDRFSIHISWIGLLKGQLNIHDLVLENPHIDLLKDRFGNFNLIQALYTPKHTPAEPGKNGGPPFNILLHRLRVINGFVQYNASEETAGNPIHRLVFQNVNLTIANGNLLKQTGRIFCRIAEGNFQIKGVRTDIHQLSFKANVQKNRITELLFDGNTDGVFVDITGTVEKPFTRRPIIDLHLKSRVSLSKIKGLVPLGSDLSGEVQADSNLKGTIQNPDIDLQLRYKGGKLAGRRIQGILLKCRLKNKMLNISEANAITPLGRFDIKGHMDFSKAISGEQWPPALDANAISYKFSIQHKAPRLENMTGISALKGAVRANIELEGKGVDPRSLRAESTLWLYADKLTAEKIHSPIAAHAKAQAGMANGRITIRSLTVDANGARLEMTGSYDVFSRRVSARIGLKAPDLSENLSKLGITGFHGKVNVTGKISGSVSDPSMDARLKGENLRFESFRFGSADAELKFSKGRLFLNRGKIMNGDSGIDLSGDVQIFDPMNQRLFRHPVFSLTFAGKALSLKDFANGMKGKLALNGRVKGEIARPKGKLDIYGDNIDLGIQKIHSLRLASRIDGGIVTVDPLTIAIVPGEKIILKGRAFKDKHYELHMAANDISIKNIQKLAFLKTTGGKISFNLDGKGEFSNPEIKGKAIIDHLTFNNKKLEKILFNIGVENQTVYIDGGPGIDLKATYGLQTRSFSAIAHFDRTDLTSYLQLLGKKELSGTITGSMDARGSFKGPLRIDGGIKISRLSLFWNNTAFITGRDLGIFVKNNEITVPKMRLSLLDHGYFTIFGTGKLWKDINLNAEGIIPFSLLPIFTDSVSDAGGKARISLRIRENGLQPLVDFDAAFENGNIMIPGLSQHFHHINGHIRATPKTVMFENITGMLGNGRLEVSGSVDLDRYRISNFGLNLKADNLSITIPDVLDVRLSSELSVRGSSKKSLVKGDVMMLEGTYHKDVRVNPIESIGEESREAALPTSKSFWPIFDNMAIDCRIRYKSPFVVDNNIALLTIKPDLYVRGTVNRPLISGRAEVESGTVFFRKNEFNVQKGILDFINPYKIEPTIDIRGETKIREWTVFLDVSGTSDNLKFNLTSDPSLSEQDIVSLLITGKTTQELIAREGGSSLSPKQMLADVLAQSAQKEIKSATGLDVVALEYNEAKNAEASDEMKVTVGKELSKRVAVKYGVQTNSAKVIQKVITEYKFFETLLMNAFEDSEGNYGAGIQFRLEFR